MFQNGVKVGYVFGRIRGGRNFANRAVLVGSFEELNHSGEGWSALEIVMGKDAELAEVSREFRGQGGEFTFNLHIHTGERMQRLLEKRPSIRIWPCPFPAFFGEPNSGKDGQFKLLDFGANLEPAVKIRKTIDAQFDEVTGKLAPAGAPITQKIFGDNRANDSRDLAEPQRLNQRFHARAACPVTRTGGVLTGARADSISSQNLGFCWSASSSRMGRFER